MHKVSNEDFENYIDASFERIPDDLKKYLDNVQITYQEIPTRFQIAKIAKSGTYPFLLGLYEGVPKTRRGRYGIGGPLPDKITLFKRNIERVSQSRDHLIKVIADTLEHELGHHFGMDEKMLRDIQR